MNNLNDKEQLIDHVARTTNLANAIQQCLVDAKADLAMSVDAALMIVRGAAQQCTTNEMRCDLLNLMNEYLVSIVAMNNSSPVIDPEAPKTLQ